MITIIAILASLITAAAINALNASKRAAITVEIGQLADAVERFKNDTGGAYPPNSMNTLVATGAQALNYKGDNVHELTKNDFTRSFRKAFPRHQEPDELLAVLAGKLNPSTTIIIDGNLEGGMSAAEAIYFWLGGFSSDPVYPISGAGGPSFANATNPAVIPVLGDEILENRAPLYEFDLTRLGPRTDEGLFDESNGRYVVYLINISGTVQRRRINLWTYAPKGRETPYVYFDASRHDPVDYDLDMSGVAELKLFGLKKIREGFSGSATPAPKDIHFVNKGKYQILHAGLDDEWGFKLDPSPSFVSPFSIAKATGTVNDGDASALMLFPTGPFTGDIADTLSNFATGTLESAQE